MKDKVLNLVNSCGVRWEMKQLYVNLCDFTTALHDFENSPESEKENMKERLLMAYSNLQLSLWKFKYYYDLDDYTIRREIDAQITKEKNCDIE